MWKTRVCDILGIEFPILQGGMSIAGNAELAAAVSEAGGLGMLGSNPGWSPPEQHVEHLRAQIRKLKALATKPFGVNFTLFVMQEKGKEIIDMAIEEGIKIAVTSGGNPRIFTRQLKDAGVTVMHVVGNARQAKAAEDAGVDIVIAEGYEAGGVNFPDELTTMVLVPYVTRAVQIPVVAAGGIYDARGFVAAMALGAEGVQMGSRFLATKECHVHDNYKQAIINARETDTNITRRKLGLRVRSLKNEYTLHLEEMDRGSATIEDIRAYIGFGTAREGMMDGDTVRGDMLVGQVAGMIAEVVSAGDVVREVIAGATAIVERCNKLLHA
jgi:enoyl-[acyl-carrier protein] reductase II